MPIDQIENKWLRRAAIIAAFGVFPVFVLTAGVYAMWEFTKETMSDLKDVW